MNDRISKDHPMLLRVWQSGFLSWWTEVWLLDTKGPSYFPRIDDPRTPPDPPGYRREALALSSFRWVAKMKARRMGERIMRGLHPEHDVPDFEEMEIVP